LLTELPQLVKIEIMEKNNNKMEEEKEVLRETTDDLIWKTHVVM
jgi:hypothetical protein